MAADAADEVNLRAQAGDIVYNMMRMWQGAAGVAPEQCMISPAYVVLAPKDETSSEFFNYRFENARMLYLLWAYSHGLTSDRLRLYFADFARIPITIPSLPEQKKIAAFLGVVDAKVAALRARRLGLETYKRGLMQKLFSRTLRFTKPDGSAFPDWEEKRLGDVAEIYQPRTIGQTDMTKEGFDVYGANGLIGKYHSFNHELAQVTVTCRGNTCGTVGMTKPKAWITGNAMVINLDTSIFALKQFMFYELSNTNWTYLITGSGQPQITGEIKKHKFAIPHSDEQRLIADALHTMDAKISAVGDQIARMEAFKKGLLQQMFV